MSYLSEADPEIAEILAAELTRQEDGIELIASENYTSRAVMEAQASVLTNKYAEGLPGKRYYGGCEEVDRAEALARSRVKELFGPEAANVQPHSGAQANAAVFLAMLEAGDTFLGMSLSEGGHLSHGSPVNFSGKLFNAVSYGLNSDTHRIDLDQVRDLARAHQPKMIVVGASAYPRQIDFEPFREIADEVGARLMADIAHPAGLVAAGLHPSPVPWCDFVTSTTHKTLRGPRGGFILCRKADARKINSGVFPGIQGGPLMHVIAAKAVAFGEALRPDFKVYAKNIIDNAQVLAETLMSSGLDLVSGGTDTHLMLMDLTRQDIPGRKAERMLGRAGLTVNKNTVPNEQRSPFVTSGVRIGTPAVTTRGLGPVEMVQIGRWIVEVLENIDDEKVQSRVEEGVRELCARFPVYP